MCGIAGYLNLDLEKTPSKQKEDVISSMIHTLSHRGPDAVGHYTDEFIGLAHCRLSIIDLVTGDQPMQDADNSTVIVYNGEIYNYLELRAELASTYAFKTNSDTEVILAAYRKWSLRCVERFNGMWAFALWDKKKQMLFCSRDRFGEKPFFYSIFKDKFYFASEIKALFAAGVPKRIRQELLDIYLSLTFIPAPDTFFKDIYKLEPGVSLIVQSGKISKVRYWDINIGNLNDVFSENSVLEQFEELFQDAVRIRMRSDVKFGTFLSGGIDSSSVLAVCSQLSSTAINTFTAGFNDKQFDERNVARSTARKFFSNHFEFEIEPLDVETIMTKLSYHFDEPFGDSSAIACYYLAKLTKNHVKMTLTGDGGDEALMGYTIFQGEAFAHYFQLLPSILRKRIIPLIIDEIYSISGNHYTSQLIRIKNVIESSNLDFLSRLELKRNGIPPKFRANLLKDCKNIHPAYEYLFDQLKPVENQTPLNKLSYWLLKYSLSDDMLCKVDRTAMANSLETRLPFLDYRLIELMLKTPVNIKFKRFQRKYILKKTIGKRLPPIVLHGAKKGFVVPLESWFKNNTVDFIEHAILSKLQNIFPKVALKQLIEINKNGSHSFSNGLWAMAVLGYVMESN